MAAKLYPVLAIVMILRFGAISLRCSGSTLYTVGDSSGWDISTNLDTWANDKTFLIGDVLLFQYSSYHSVSEVTKDSYDGCNTTDVLQTNSNGNTSFPLTSPGDRYFVCGNRLHCLAGMKLHVNVVQDQGAGAPADTPQAAAGGGSGGSLPPGSTKSNNPYNNPSSAISNQAGLIINLVLALALLSFPPVFLT